MGAIHGVNGLQIRAGAEGFEVDADGVAFAADLSAFAVEFVPDDRLVGWIAGVLP